MVVAVKERNAEMGFFLSKRAVTIYEIFIILIMILILISQSRKKKAQEERRKINNRKIRNEQLENRLKNPDIQLEKEKALKPFDVQYNDLINSEQEIFPDLQVEIEVHSRMSVRKYLFDLSREVTIGRDDRNLLPLNDASAAPVNCSVFKKNGSVFVKNLCISSPVCIQRGKKRKKVYDQLVKLESKDIIFCGDTKLHITIYKK